MESNRGPAGKRVETIHRPHGEQRRTDLLEAVIRLVAREGVSAVTHRAVAREAGVTHRLTTYYFQTKEKMLEEAFRYLAARSLERASEAVTAVVTGDEADAMGSTVDAVVDAVLGGLHAEPGGVMAELALVLEAQRDPALAHDYALWQTALEDVLVEHARVLGSDDAATDARIILAAMRGLQIERLGRLDRGEGREELRKLVERLLTRL